jgi:hypothetical protein
MAAVTVYAQSAGDWDKVNNWDTVAGGGGTDYTDPQDGTDAFTCDCNGFIINLNKTVVVTKIQATAAGGGIKVPDSTAATVGAAAGIKTLISSSYNGAMVTWGTGTCSLTLNGSVAYSGTNTSGMIPVGGSQTLTIQNTGGAGTTSVSNTSTGYAIVPASTGILVVSNSGGTALSETSSGRCVSASGSGTCTITGAITATGGGYGLLNSSTSVSHTVTGDVSNSDVSGAAIRSSGGTITVDGNLSSSNGATVVNMVGGTFVWTGARTLAAATDCKLVVSTGTINITSLVLTNSGRFYIEKQGGGTLTVGSGGTLAQINNQSHAAQACVLGTAADIVNPSGAGTILVETVLCNISGGAMSPVPY